MSMNENLNTKHIGTLFDQCLLEEGILADVQQESVKKVLALTLQEEMKRKKISKVAMAKKLQTSRAALNRILDPLHKAITLGTMERVATVLGKKVMIVLVDL